ncbi:MAG TPA: winged helix-turn-helix transcriptional regulator [Polyangiales bacterium]|nr:winged helix-turn-helix transcriptional regulator [Polyangiales bacterium]
MTFEAPVPGRKVRGSQTGRPLMAAFDLLGRRGVLRILWELRDGQPQTFRALQAAAELSPATLNTRLRELKAAGIIQLDGGYHLSKLGLALLPALEPLHGWAVSWAKQLGKPRSRG